MALNLKQSLPYLGGFLGAVVLATAAFVGGYWYRGVVLDQLQPASEVPALPSPSPEIEAQVINLDHGLDMSDWVTSTSENLGISLRHPKDWYFMDFDFRSSAPDVEPALAFGLTYPLQVDLNKYQQVTAVGEKFRLEVVDVTNNGLASTEKVEEALNREADGLINLLGFEKVDRKTFDSANFRGILNYNYEVRGQLDYVDGYLFSNDGNAYHVIFSSLEPEVDKIDNNYLQICEQILSTLTVIK